MAKAKGNMLMQLAGAKPGATAPMLKRKPKRKLKEMH